MRFCADRISGLLCVSYMVYAWCRVVLRKDGAMYGVHPMSDIVLQGDRLALDTDTGRRFVSDLAQFADFSRPTREP
jgi:hypothetical protein